MSHRVARTCLPFKAAAFQGMLACVILMQPSLWGEQRILDFHSDITLQRDGSVSVLETIRVQLDGSVPGINRCQRVRYVGARGEGNVLNIGHIEITRDGKLESIRYGSSSPLTIVDYTGDRDVLLPPGEYAYTFAYTARRPIGFPAGSDELFWNVTGNDWPYPIDAASVRVVLPEPVEAAELQMRAYTGPSLEPDANGVWEVEEPGVITFATTRQLGEQEGLAVSVAFPKRVLSEIAPNERMIHTLLQGIAPYVVWAGLALVLFYYGVAWWLVGKDPAKGPVRRRKSPPEDVSPGALRFAWKMGHDAKTFASAILSMAVKGHLAIEDRDGVFRLAKKDGRRALTTEERAAAAPMFANHDAVDLGKLSATMFAGRRAYETALESRFEGTSFRVNRGWLIPGVLLSVAVVLLSVVACTGGDFPILLIAGWLTIWTCGVTVIVMTLAAQWKRFRAGRHRALLLLLFGVLGFSPWLLGECFAGSLLLLMLPATVVGEIVAVGLLGLVFHYLLKAPTPLGREMMDETEGFRQFLSDKAAWGENAGPAAVAALFQRLLPYAVALEKEAAWAEGFAAALGKHGVPPNDERYCPPWYSGDHWQSGGAVGLAERMAGAFVDVVWACSALSQESKR